MGGAMSVRPALSWPVYRRRPLIDAALFLPRDRLNRRERLVTDDNADGNE